jgi:hypothetical protein
VVLQARACGCPVVGFGVGAMGEVDGVVLVNDLAEMVEAVVGKRWGTVMSTGLDEIYGMDTFIKNIKNLLTTPNSTTTSTQCRDTDTRPPAPLHTPPQ